MLRFDSAFKAATKTKLGYLNREPTSAERPMATKTQLELETLWTTQNGIDGVDYRFGDIVRVKTGEHIGKSGEIIALISIEVEPTYLIELQTGDSIAVKQSELDPAQGNSGRRLILQAQ